MIISDMRRNTTQKPDVSRDKYKCKVPGCDAELRSDKVKFWIRMEKKMLLKRFQEKKEAEKESDNVATAT